MKELAAQRKRIKEIRARLRGKACAEIVLDKTVRAVAVLPYGRHRSTITQSPYTTVRPGPVHSGRGKAWVGD